MDYKQIESFEEFWEAYHNENLYLSPNDGYYVESGYTRDKRTLDISRISTVIENINGGYYYKKIESKYVKVTVSFGSIAKTICNEYGKYYYKDSKDNFVKINPYRSLNYILSLCNNNNIYEKEQ